MKKIVKIFIVIFLTIVSVDSFAQSYDNLKNKALALTDTITQNADESTQRRVNSAKNLLAKVEQMYNYIDNLTELAKNNQIPLPVGISSKKNNYKLVVSSLSHNNDSTTEIFMSCAIPFKENRTLAFDGKCRFTGNCGPSMPGKLSLIEACPINFGKTFEIEFKNGSCCEFDCDGISRFYVKASLRFTSEKIIFYNDKDSLINTPPTIDFEAYFDDLKDFEIQLENRINFGFKELKDFIFHLENITIDNSETYTSNSTNFPDNYFTNGDDKNLWTGLSVKLAEVKLPKALKSKSTKDTTTRTTIRCENLVIDRFGISAFAKASDICAGDHADTTKWDITLEDFALLVTKNRIDEVTFNGEINLPPLGNFSLLPYTAAYNRASEEFDFKCNVSGEREFPALSSKLTLNETSFIDIRIKNGDFYPTICADGKITIDAKIDKDKFKLTIPNVTFEGLKISREKPYFNPGKWNFTDLELPKIGGFNLALREINFVKDALNLGSDVSFNEKIKGFGKFNLNPDFEKFTLKSLDISRLAVEYNSDNFSVKGEVEVVKNDSIYGNGFRGNVGLKLIDKFSVDALAFFGNINKQKYFFVDVFASSSKGLFMIPPCINVTGLGGGVYKSMNQTSDNSTFGKALSGICYKPDFNVGFGFMAAAKFNLGADNICTANTTLELQFNKNWGLNYLQMKGDAAFMTLPGKLGELSALLNKNLDQVEKGGGLAKTKSDDSPNDIVDKDVKSQSPLTASILMKYDNTSKIFNANLKAFLDAGVMYGIGDNKKLVDASARFGDRDWYLHMGTPSSRCGVEVLNLLKLNGYFMLGNQIPGLPMPPENVLSGLTDAQRARFTARHGSDSLASGKGLAFGLGFQTNCEVTPWPFYAKFDIGAGGEFLLSNYGKNAYCEGRTGAVGINGWYAEAQAWAYLDAALGIRVKLFRKQRKFDFANLGAGACLVGMGPNPFYFTGVVNAHYSVLGGLFKGRCSIDFEVGENCKVVRGQELLAEDIIRQLTPAGGENNVSVFASPQVILSIPANENFDILDSASNKNNTYRVRLEKFEVYDQNGNSIKGKKNFDEEKLVCTFDPEDAFESKTSYKVLAKVVFEQKNGNDWVAVKDEDQSDYIEEKSITFTSGERPKFFTDQAISYAYPKNRQYNYLKDECKTGYICLKDNYAYLFEGKDVPEGYEQKLCVSTLKGECQYTTFSFTKNSKVENTKLEIDYDLGSISFAPNTIYKISILNVPKRQVALNENITNDYIVNGADSIRNTVAEGTLNQLEVKEIYSMAIRTSKFATFTQKVEALGLEGVAVVHGMDPVLKNVNINITSDDYFDGIESQRLNVKDNLVCLNADLDNTKWYRNSIYSKFYANYKEQDLDIERVHSFPPKDAMSIFNPNFATHDRLLDSEIETNTPSGLPQTGNLGYYVVFYCHDDIKAMRDKIAVKSLKGLALSQLETEILNYSIAPEYSSGEYPYTLSYRLPGKNIITSKVSKKLIIK